MKKRFLIILILLFLLPGCSIDLSTPEPTPDPTIEQPTPEPTPTPEPEFDISEYKAIASNLNDSIMDLSILLSNMGQYMYNYWVALENIGGTIDYDIMIDSAYKWIEENADTSKDDILSAYDKIEKLHNGFVIINIDDPLAEDIAEKLFDLYNAFFSLYILITQPSGEIDWFANDFNRYSNIIVENNELISSLVSS